MTRTMLILLAAVAACQVPGPRPVEFGSEACRHCHMTVADERFVSQLITHTGKILVFDDVGCLLSALEDEIVPSEKIARIWVTNFLTTDSLLEAQAAWFVAAPASVATPMASGLLAVATAQEADSLAVLLQGKVLQWPELRQSDQQHPH